MNELVAHIAAELRDRAAFLLEAGRDASTTTHRSRQVPSPLTTLAGALEAARTVSSLMPTLLEEASVHAFAGDRTERTSSALRAQLPRAAWAYEQSDDAWTPRYWLRPVDEMRAAPAALRWLMHLVRAIDEHLDELVARVATQADELTAARVGLESLWSDSELERLDTLQSDLEQGRERLARARRAIMVHAGGAVHPNGRFPRPAPRGRSWERLVRHSRYWLDPSQSMGMHLRHLLSGPLEIADAPFLYERWCALKLLDAFERQGLRPASAQKALWTIFLGGRIELDDSEGRSPMEVWVEPRLGSHAHPCGLSVHSHGHEQTPDLVINVSTAAGTESIVLDPTMGRSAEHLLTKGRYATSLKRDEVRTIAGVKTVRHPRRSWAMAPLQERSCRLLGGATETVGVIPMLPGDYTAAPLDAFVEDLVGWTGS